MTAPRSGDQRKQDVLTRLAAPAADCWVATAAGASTDSGDAYLVPLTLAWFRDRILLATARTAPTARNIEARGRARLGLGPTRDVIMIDATLEATLPVSESGETGEAYATQADWDPRTAGDAYVVLVLRPTRIQAWREADEIPGRTLMRDGTWVV
jgi:hypothetical protein